MLGPVTIRTTQMANVPSSVQRIANPQICFISKVFFPQCAKAKATRISAHKVSKEVIPAEGVKSNIFISMKEAMLKSVERKKTQPITTRKNVKTSLAGRSSPTGR